MFFSALIHSAEVYSPRPIACYPHSDDFVGDREFDSNVSYFLILIKACSIFVCTHFTWFFCPFTLISNEWEDEYASFRPKSFKVHPINSQCVPLPMISFDYVNDLPPIHKGPFRPLVGIMTHLVVSDLLIYPFSSGEPTYT